MDCIGKHCHAIRDLSSREIRSKSPRFFSSKEHWMVSFEKGLMKASCRVNLLQTASVRNLRQYDISVYVDAKFTEDASDHLLIVVSRSE